MEQPSHGHLGCDYAGSQGWQKTGNSSQVGDISQLRTRGAQARRDDDRLAVLVAPVALFGLFHKTRLHYIGVQYTTSDNKTAGILLQGDKDNYRAILVALQGVTGIPVVVGEKDREFVPVGVKTDVTKGGEEKQSAANKTTNAALPAEPSKGTVNVSSNPTGADVLVDGDFVGNAPAALKLAAGKHAVTVKMSGYKDWTKDISVQSGSEVQLTANLEK